MKQSDEKIKLGRRGPRNSPIQEDPEEVVPEEELDLLIDARLLTGIEKFISTHDGGDFGGINPPREKTQYKHSGKGLKKHGGKPPIDYRYVEDFVDLKIAFEQGDFERALPLYYKLRRLIA